MNRRKFIAGGSTAALAGLAGCMGLGTPRGESTYTGYVVDNEHEKGIIFRNSKIKLKTDPKSGTSEEFYIRTPEDQEMYDEAARALQEQKRVTVSYERSFFENPTDAFGEASVVVDLEVHE